MAETKTYYLNMGPAHPAMHGVVRLVLQMEGETIRGCETEIGYLHRAFEKHGETETWNNVIPWTDRLNYVSPLINNTGYVMAVEKLAGVTIPERGQYLRVLSCEISRITDHLTCIGASAMELGAFTVFLYLIEGREELYRCVDRLTGARITTSYTRVGGVKGDLPAGFEEALKAALAKVRQVTGECEKLLNGNRIFRDRTEGTGIISKEDAVAYGITGPFLRSTGVPYDVRRAQPYLVYDKLEFDVPVGEAGDNYDRYLVRLAEIEQSIRIIEQCFKQMPGGEPSVPEAEMRDAFKIVDDGKHGDTELLWKYKAKLDQTLDASGRSCHPGILTGKKDVVLPPKEETYGSIEGLMRHFELIMWQRGLRPPAGEAYMAVEGGNGELGFHVVSDGGEVPYRVRVRPPCLFPMQALGKMLTGGYVADVVPTFGSVNMIAGELDR